MEPIALETSDGPHAERIAILRAQGRVYMRHADAMAAVDRERAQGWPTCQQFFDLWVVNRYENGAWGPIVRSGRELIARRVWATMAPVFGHVPMAALDAATINRTLARMSPSTAIAAVGVLRPMFTDAQTWGWDDGTGAQQWRLTRSPMDQVRTPAAPEPREKELLSDDHLREMIKLAKQERVSSDPMLCWFIFMATLGFRLHEVRALRWRNVQLRSGTIWLVYTAAERKDRKPFMLPLPPELAGHIDLERRRGPDDMVWPTTKVRETAHRWMTDFLRDLSARVGGPPDVTPHHLRSSTATALIEQGAESQSVQRLLGHSTAKMTERYARTATQKHVLTVVRPRIKNLVGATQE